MWSIEKYCGDLEDFLEDNAEVNADNLGGFTSGVSLRITALACRLEFSKNSSNPQIFAIREKLFYLSRWVLKHPESVANDEFRAEVLFAVAQVYQAIEWGLI